MKIGITKTEKPASQQFYIDWIKGNDAIEVVTLSADTNSANDIKEYDALVLSGGVDVHPRYYGMSTSYPNAPDEFIEKRDEFEIAAFKAAQENNLPVLGICRGLQLINVIHKGKLKQDLGDDTLNKVHRGGPDKSHAITVAPDTILYDIIGDNHAQTNSAHHQSIDIIGEGLQVNALSAEGIIEGIERKDPAGKPFLLAVQWHPERLFRFGLQDSPASKGIRTRFIEEIKKSIPAK